MCQFYLSFFRTVVGLRGTDGVVLAVEKLITSKLYEPGTNTRIFNVDTHIGMVNLKLFILLIKAICFYISLTASSYWIKQTLALAVLIY